MRTRQDVAALSVGDADAARREAWHPVLETYAKGVAAMQELDAQVDPQSWIWASNTHGFVPGTPLRPGWGQCEHGSRFFLPWHRAYLTWFESTIRELTGEPQWALPYWNYSSTEASLRIPAEFSISHRESDGELVENALFVDGRDTNPLLRDNVNLIAALSQLRFVKPFPETGFGGPDREGYAGFLEMKPHNYVHGDIGGLMNFPSTAARDPIFWLHHANVDRLWEIWQSFPDSVKITDVEGASVLSVTEWNSATFWFGREQAPTTYAMASVEDSRSPALDYEYDTLALPTQIADKVVAAREAASLTQGGLTLDAIEAPWRPVAASFNLASDEVREIPFDQRQIGLDDSTPTRLVLELAGARATDPHPAYLVEVRSSADAEPHIAGGFSTFGLAGTPASHETNYLVDASAVLPALVDEGWTGGELVVRLVADQEQADAAGDDRAIQVRQVTVYTQSE